MQQSLARERGHPGTHLLTAIHQAGCSKSQFARHLGISRQTLYEILSGKQSVTATMALKISRLTGTKPETWLELQCAFDLVQARRQLRQALADIPQLNPAWEWMSSQ